MKTNIKAELGLFRNHISVNRPNPKEDVFKWWKKYSQGFPQLKESAKNFLCIPATSVSSERTFSMAGLLYANTLRNR
jgi:hypothetical protein